MLPARVGEPTESIVDDRPEAKPPPTPFGPGRARRVAFAVTLVALPLFGTLLGEGARDAATLLPFAPAVLRAPPASSPTSVFGDLPPSAAPDHAMLDANDVRRALPAPAHAVAGVEATTL